MTSRQARRCPLIYLCGPTVLLKRLVASAGYEWKPETSPCGGAQYVGCPAKSRDLWRRTLMPSGRKNVLGRSLWPCVDGKPRLRDGTAACCGALVSSWMALSCHRSSTWGPCLQPLRDGFVGKEVRYWLQIDFLYPHVVNRRDWSWQRSMGWTQTQESNTYLNDRDTSMAYPAVTPHSAMDETQPKSCAS